jgi:hypothetical protein
MATSTYPSVLEKIGSRRLSRSSLDRLNGADFQVFESAIYNELDAKCSGSPLYWGQNWTFTENPKWESQGLEWKQRFPAKSYFEPLFRAFAERSRLFIPKTREMMTSWCAMLWAAHQAQWFKAEVIVQTDAEEKAKELVGYAECLYRNQADWLKERHKLATLSLTELRFAAGGRVFGIPKGEHKIRMYHPTIYIMDEASFLPEAQPCYDAAEPVAGQIIAISSAGPGWFGEQCAR